VAALNCGIAEVMSEVVLLRIHAISEIELVVFWLQLRVDVTLYQPFAAVSCVYAPREVVPDWRIIPEMMGSDVYA